VTGHVRGSDIRAQQVARAGGEDALAAGKGEFLAQVWLSAGDCIRRSTSRTATSPPSR